MAGGVFEQMSGYAVKKGAPAEERGSDTASKGAAAQHEKGVLYQGPWETLHDGFNEHVRRCARALSEAGLPVRLRSFVPRQFGKVPFETRDPRDECKDLLETTIAQTVCHICQVVPSEGIFHHLMSHRYYSGEQLAYLNSLKVLSTVFERTAIPQHDIEALKRAGQVWVACKANAKMLKDQGLERVRVVPIPYLADDPLLAFEGRERIPGPIRFYSIGKWEPRKEHRNALGSFLRAFKPGEASYYLKTSPSLPECEGYPDGPEAALRVWLTDPVVQQNGWNAESVGRSLFIIKKYLPEEQLRELHRTCDVYVSLARGEGFDMPAFDSKLAGNLMVYTPSGGPQDFAGEFDVEVPTSGEVTCHSFYRWGEESLYLDYEVEDASRALREAFELAHDGQRQRGMSLDPFSMKSVGKRMAQYVQELRDRAGV